MIDVGNLLQEAGTLYAACTETADYTGRIALALESIAASQLVLAGLAADQMRIIVGAQKLANGSGLVVPQ